MPGSTGGRSPEAPDRGVCAISPSDLVGYTGNLINLVKDLEQRVAELEAANVTANQLSDLSQQVGWVGGITYAGVDGWTQTSYGTLIPPAGVSLSTLGFTMSDGNTYPFVVMDENGVLQYGFTNTGATGGTFGGTGKCDLYNGSSSINYTDNNVHVFTGFTTQSSDSLVSISGSGQITFAATGMYLLGCVMSVQYPVGAGADRKFLTGFGDGSAGWYVNLFQEVEITGQSGIHVFSGTFMAKISNLVTDTFYCQVADNGTAGSTRTVDLNSLWFARLRGL